MTRLFSYLAALVMGLGLAIGSSAIAHDAGKHCEKFGPEHEGCSTDPGPGPEPEPDPTPVDLNDHNSKCGGVATGVLSTVLGEGGLPNPAADESLDNDADCDGEPDQT